MVCTSLRCGLHNTVHVVNSTEYKNNSIYTIYIYTTYNTRLKNSGVISPHVMKHKMCFNKLLLIQGPLVKH